MEAPKKSYSSRNRLLASQESRDKVLSLLHAPICLLDPAMA